MSEAILLISCPDKKGVVATVTNYLYEKNGNVLDADQHIDAQTNTFFMRIEWSLEGFNIEEAKIAESFIPIAKKFDMEWDLYFCRNPFHLLKEQGIKKKRNKKIYHE